MGATVQVIVAAMVMLFVSLGCAASSSGGTYECTDGNTTQVTIIQPRSTVKLNCPSSYKVNPVISDNVENVFCDSNCNTQKKLSELCPGASGTQAANAGKPVNLSITQLPSTPTTFYLKCVDSLKSCMFAVAVAAPPLGGPQVCAVNGSSVHLGLQGEGGKVVFGCASNSKLYPAKSDKVYDEDCKKETDLKDLKLSGSNSEYFTLAATKKPKNRKICYICGSTDPKGESSENCAVRITVSAGSGLAARSAFGVVLPCVLALLHFT